MTSELKRKCDQVSEVSSGDASLNAVPQASWGSEFCFTGAVVRRSEASGWCVRIDCVSLIVMILRRVRQTKSFIAPGVFALLVDYYSVWATALAKVLLGRPSWMRHACCERLVREPMPLAVRMLPA